MEFRLHPGLDPEAARAQFVREGFVQLMPWLADACAAALHAELVERVDWRELINSGDKVFELDREGQSKLGSDGRARLDALIDAGARSGFQHRYESIRIPDDRHGRTLDTDLLGRFALFMSSEAVLHILRQITGLEDVDFVDAQATSYRPGDFLTAHHDEVAGKKRRAAYVFGLSEGWNTEWGGLLLFHDPAGDVTRGLKPRFNCLNLFRVPQTHSVSQVATFAATNRISVTGWLRALG
jgi:Rps23 Pro-64 3,4-dihydroxylase Tpa1-like proline 4-hydroxylase